MEETFDPTTAPDEGVLLELAEDSSIDPGEERLNNLHLYGTELHQLTAYRERQIWMFTSTPLSFSRDGLDIHLALANKNGRHDEVDIHFRPQRDGLTLCQRRTDIATELILSSLISLQDFCLLVRGGYIRRPSVIRGNTNAAMAATSRRAGFRVYEEDGFYSCRANFTDVQEAVLCGHAQHMIDRLAYRLIRHRVSN